MSKVESRSKDGIRRRVIFNETVLMINSDDDLAFMVLDEAIGLEFTINFSFSGEGKALTTTGNVTDDGKTINMVLHQWESSLGTELTQPIEFKSNGKRIWLKFKTWAEKNASHRSFQITIWGEQ